MEPAADLRIVLSRRCDGCQGDGIVYHPHCRICGEPVPLAAAGAELPCGHKLANWREHVACVMCEGAGRVGRELRLEELAGLVGLLLRQKGRGNG